MAGMKQQVLGFEESAPQARALAAALKCDYATVSVHRFPDGESLVTVPVKLRKTVLFYRSLNDPNAKLVELLLAIEAARRHGCKRVVLIAPYLSYMRQDMEFKPGQAVSQHIIGGLLSEWVDDLVTVDPHLHRTPRLSSVLPYCSSVARSAAPLLGAFLRQQQIQDTAVLVGPDAESRQWVEQVAQACGLDFVIAGKERFGDRAVKVTLPAYNYQDRHAILVDDVISSGKTLVETTQALRNAGIRQVDALCTHALFAPGAEESLREAGIRHVWSTSSIPQTTSCIDLTPVLVEGLHELLGEPR
ncbi:MAG TPA: ribose-phosphate diphosphokinase [Dongiaceae bacterium]|nr:ribose-phosphate diphosphokinase [Dongiaceae bacterium]